MDKENEMAKKRKRVRGIEEGKKGGGSRKEGKLEKRRVGREYWEENRMGGGGEPIRTRK